MMFIVVDGYERDTRECHYVRISRLDNCLNIKRLEARELKIFSSIDHTQPVQQTNNKLNNQLDFIFNRLPRKRSYLHYQESHNVCKCCGWNTRQWHQWHVNDFNGPGWPDNSRTKHSRVHTCKVMLLRLLFCGPLLVHANAKSLACGCYQYRYKDYRVTCWAASLYSFWPRCSCEMDQGPYDTVLGEPSPDEPVPCSFCPEAPREFPSSRHPTLEQP